jgi:hypothetical protein
MAHTLKQVTEAIRNTETIRQYISDRLPEEERAALHKRLLVDFDLVKDFETSLKMREALERLRERDELRNLVHPRRTRALWGAAGAASAALAAVVLYLGYSHRPPPPLMAASLSSLRTRADSPLTVAGQYSFALMRSANAVPTVTLPAAGALELRALTTTLSGNSDFFRVRLDAIGPSATTSRIGVVEHVVPDADGFVAIYVDAGRVAAGDYSLDVQSETPATGPPEHFEFKLQRPGQASSPSE